MAEGISFAIAVVVESDLLKLAAYRDDIDPCESTRRAC